MKLTTALFLLLIAPLAHSESRTVDVRTAILEGEFSYEAAYESSNSFDCQDKIMALVDLSGFKRGVLSANMEWIAPDGDVQERVEMKVGVNSQGRGEFYSFIQFHKGKGAGIFAFIDPSMSLEEFIGPWTVNIYVNGNKLASHDFEVAC